MKRPAVLAVLAVLAVAGAAGAAPITVLPKPAFPAPAGGAGTNTVRFTILSTTPLDPGREVTTTKPAGLTISGPDGTTQHVVSSPRYAFDFRNYAWPPRIAPGEREFAYEEVVWAREAPGVLYVETAHSTYAKSTYGLNGYLNAIDLKTKKLRWRSPAQVANANNFVLLNTTLVSGHGFTAEPDYLYAVDAATGKVKGRVLIPSAAQKIVRHGNVLTVDLYDARVVVRVSGA